MSTEIKDIPADELERIEQDANKKYLVNSELPEYLSREAFGLRKGYVDGAKAEYLRHLSLSSKPEIGLPWEKTNNMPAKFQNVIAWTNKGHFFKTCVDASGNWDTYELEAYEGEFITHYLILTGPSESIPSSEPLPATEETKLNVEQIVQFTEEVGYFYEIVGGGKGKNLIWENIELGSRSTTAELLVCFLEGVGLRLSTIDMAEPAKESQPDAFLEWLHEEIEFCEPRAKGEEIQNGTSGNYWTGQINLLRQVREKYLSLHAQPKPEPSEEKDEERWSLRDFQDWVNSCAESDADDDVTLWSNGAHAAYNYLKKGNPSPPSVKPESNIDATVRAIKSRTEKLIALGPEACRKFLKDAGISTDETDGEPSVKPEREDNGIIRAMREHTESLVAQGPEACRRFLKDAGILEEENLEPTPPSRPARGRRGAGRDR